MMVTSQAANQQQALQQTGMNNIYCKYHTKRIIKTTESTKHMKQISL